MWVFVWIEFHPVAFTLCILVSNSVGVGALINQQQFPSMSRCSASHALEEDYRWRLDLWILGWGCYCLVVVTQIWCQKQQAQISAPLNRTPRDLSFFFKLALFFSNPLLAISLWTYSSYKNCFRSQVSMDLILDKGLKFCPFSFIIMYFLPSLEGF